MQETIWIIIGTALSTAVLSALCFYILYVVKLRPSLSREVEKAGAMIEQRVHRGVVSAGEELLPRFREKVTEGFTRALAEWPSSEMSRIARTGANVVGESFNSLLGKKKT